MFTTPFITQGFAETSTVIPVPTFDEQLSWFGQIESIFLEEGFDDSLYRFHYARAYITPTALDFIEHETHHPVSIDPYGSFKHAILLKLSPLNTMIANIPVSQLVLGDRKPSQLLLEMRRIGGINLTDVLLRDTWLRCLPGEMHCTLAVQLSVSLDELAKVADTLTETHDSDLPTVQAIASTSADPNATSQMTLCLTATANASNALPLVSSSPHSSNQRPTSNTRSRPASRTISPDPPTKPEVNESLPTCSLLSQEQDIQDQHLDTLQVAEVASHLPQVQDNNIGRSLVADCCVCSD